jgi:hypothetical protein
LFEIMAQEHVRLPSVHRASTTIEEALPWTMGQGNATTEGKLW